MKNYYKKIINLGGKKELLSRIDGVQDSQTSGQKKPSDRFFARAG